MTDLPMNPEPHPPVVARVRVMGKDWQLLYMTLPVGTHDLYARQFSYRAPAQDESSITFTREEVKKHEACVESLRMQVRELERAKHVMQLDLTAANGRISVMVDLLRDVLMPLSVSKIDAMTSGEDDDVQMIRDLESRIKAAIHGADSEGAKG